MSNQLVELLVFALAVVGIGDLLKRIWPKVEPIVAVGWVLFLLLLALHLLGVL